MKWIDLEQELPPMSDAVAIDRWGRDYDIKRHDKSYLSDGQKVWIGRVNYGSMTVEGREDECGVTVRFWMYRKEEALPSPPHESE